MFIPRGALDIISHFYCNTHEYLRRKTAKPLFETSNEFRIFQVKMRTLRIGIVNVFCSVGVPIGTALSGVLFRELGFYGVYIIATVLYIFAFVYGMVFIKETKPDVNIESKEPPRNTSCVDFVQDFFSLSHIKEAIRVTFKEGQHNRRLRIISLMVVVIVVMGPLHGL